MESLFAYWNDHRKILNELSESPQSITVTKIEEESNSSQTSQESSQEGNEAATNLSTNATTPIGRSPIDSKISISESSSLDNLNLVKVQDT